MTEQQEKAWDVLVSLGSETMLQVLTDYHGLQLLDEGFLKHLADEGYIEEESEEEGGDGDNAVF
jgi:hypothetical protein